MVRIKHRYLLVHILYPDSSPAKERPSRGIKTTVPDSVQFHSPTSDGLTPKILARAIRDQILYLYGDYGTGISSTGLNVKYLSPATSTAIIRCLRTSYQLVWAALTFMTHLPQLPSQRTPQPCVMQVVRVSGTIRKAEEEVIKRARVAILKARNDSQGGGSGGLDAILGPSIGGVSSKNHERDTKPVVGIEDKDDDDDEDASGVSMDEG